MQLNEMRQTGQIRGFGYDAVRREGPPHQPLFVMVGWVELGDGRRLQTEEVAAASKKATERELGARILTLCTAQA